ncbi:MAG: HAD-IB family phosphatase [Chloroflexi bacterium]|nr:HAD-IB family phosphatase [Chloroflexota bacterium]
MTDTRWTSFDLIFFDCDSTLSALEGIDELARFKGKEWRVSVLTQKAMDGDLDLRDVYGKRLAAIRPTRGQLKAIEQRYYETMVPDTAAVLAALRFLNKHVFIVSGGLADPVRGFGARLGVPADRIRAVDLEYNELAGEWWRYHEPWTQLGQTYFGYEEGPLTVSSGKPQIVRELAGSLPGRRMMIGDGMSDLAARDVVDLFVGFGGVVSRAKVRDGSEAFVKVNSLAPILPLAVGMRGAVRLLGTPHQPILERGLELALDADCMLLRQELQEAFIEEFAPLISGSRE